MKRPRRFPGKATIRVTELLLDQYEQEARHRSVSAMRTISAGEVMREALIEWAALHPAPATELASGPAIRAAQEIGRASVTNGKGAGR